MKLPLRCLGALALACTLSTLTGCAAEYDHTEIGKPRQSVLGGRVDRSGIDVPEGMVVTVHIVSYNDDHNIMTMNVRAKDPAILDVSNVISDHDFAFIGLKQGATEVEVLADNRVVLVMSAVVGPQSAGPLTSP
ncbi:hypothetical protein BH11MYX4_BH11MYX4_59950 [soil metagenome]